VIGMRGTSRTTPFSSGTDDEPFSSGTDDDGRLDPVRWRRPGGALLLRLVAVTALLVTAAVASRARPRSCVAPTVTPPVTANRPESGRPATPQGRQTAEPSGAPLAGTTMVPAGSVGVPVRLADPAGLALVRPGNRVDLLRMDDAAGHVTAVASSALVLKVTGATDPTAGGLLVAVSPTEAQRTVASAGRGFAVLIRPG
jgi:hypothetical protein